MKTQIWALIWMFVSVNSVVIAEEKTQSLATFIQSVQNKNPAFKRFKAAEQKAAAQAKSMGAYRYNPEIFFDGESRNGAEETRTYGLAQTLDISGKNVVQKRIGQQLLRSKQAEVFQARATYIANLIKALAAYESANIVMDLAKEQAVLMAQFVDISNQRNQAGDLGITEVSLARLAGAQAQSILADATASLETAQADIVARCACQVNTTPRLADIPPPLIFVDDFQQLAITLPFYKAAQAADDAAKQNVSLKKRERIPDPTFNVGAGKDGQSDLLTFGVSLPIPVFNTGSPAVREATADLLETGAALQQLRVRLLTDLSRQSRIYKGHKQALMLWNTLAQPSLDDYTKTLKKQWNAGELSASDYLLQVKQGIETAMTGAKMKANAWAAWANWMALTGEMEPWVQTSLFNESIKETQ